MLSMLLLLHRQILEAEAPVRQARRDRAARRALVERVARPSRRRRARRAVARLRPA